jgi:hypothetical protein
MFIVSPGMFIASPGMFIASPGMFIASTVNAPHFAPPAG